MEAIRSSETSGATQRTTRRHIPEDDTLLHISFRVTNEIQFRHKYTYDEEDIEGK
jgi:hypothetical protein